MRSIEEILDQAKLAERTVPLYLGGDRDLQLRYEELERRLALAKDAVPDSLGAGSPAKAVADELAGIREQMAASTVDFRLRALRRREFAALRDAHPPRKTDEGAVHPEDYLGFNTETLFDPLVRASIVAPEMTEEQLTRLLEEVLTDAQFEHLGVEAYHLNRGKVDVPFSSAASAMIPNSAAG